MKIETIEKGIEVLNNTIPYANQIKDYEFRDKAIYFTWRSGRYKLECESGSIYQLDGGCLTSSDITIVMNKLLTITLAMQS